MIDVRKIKIILWDFDDTLCFHSDHSSPEDVFDTECNVGVLLGQNVYSACSMNNSIKRFIDYAKHENKRQGLISGVDCFIHARNKENWVKEHYDIELENYCVNSQEMKLGMLIAIAEAFDYARDEILLVDDVWDNLERAADNGFQSATPVEVINFVEQHKL